MRFDARLARVLFVAGITLPASSEALAQAVNFRIRFTGQMDCNRPLGLKNVPISADVVGTLNADGSVLADLTQTAYIFSGTLRFDGRLGAAPAAAPGGTSQVRVAGRNSLRLIWNLPNNTMVVSIAVRGQMCAATYESRLRPGKSEHSMFDGNNYAYCDGPRFQTSSCEVK